MKKYDTGEVKKRTIQERQERRSFYGNGRLAERGTHKDGKRVGTWVRYWENGRLHYKGTYNKDGEMHGPWVTYTKDETVIEKYTGTFKNDKKISD